MLVKQQTEKLVVSSYRHIVEIEKELKKHNFSGQLTGADKQVAHCTVAASRHRICKLDGVAPVTYKAFSQISKVQTLESHLLAFEVSKASTVGGTSSTTSRPATSTTVTEPSTAATSSAPAAITATTTSASETTSTTPTTR